MRQRNCAAILLCGPLVAGCGGLTRVSFSGRPRPASPLNVSVWSGPHALRLDPSHVSPGPVLFDITNQSGRRERFSVRLAGGRVAAETPAIAAGQTAQMKATLRGRAPAVAALDRRVAEFARLSVSGRPRNGNDELTQP